MSDPADPSPGAESAKFAYRLYAAGHGAREFTDPDSGRRWSVAEVDAPALPGPQCQDRCLVFAAEGVVRRVWEYPDEWYLLADADLAALSHGV